MCLTEIQLLHYRLPLVRPLKMMGREQRDRVGVLIKIIDTDGCFGFGDLSPFPGLHHESLADTLNVFKKILSVFRENAQRPGAIRFSDCTPPSLRFALEWALLDLQANRQKVPPAQLLNPSFQKSLFLNGLLTGNLDEIKTGLKHGPSLSTFRSLKVKVAMRPMKEDIALIHFLDEQLPAGIKIRLDANRRWSLEQAVYFTRNIPLERIEYIEEPVDTVEKQGAFHASCGVPFALDETVSKKKDIHFVPGLKALIIKPSVIGSLEMLRSRSEFARRHGLLYVVSSAFESGVGLRILCQVAAAFGNTGTSIGLDTYKWLSTDVTFPAFNAPGNKVTIDFCSTLDFTLCDGILDKEVFRL